MILFLRWVFIMTVIIHNETYGLHMLPKSYQCADSVVTGLTNVQDHFRTVSVTKMCGGAGIHTSFWIRQVCNTTAVMCHGLWVGVTKYSFVNVYIRHCKSIWSNLWITFMFNRCHRSLAAVARVKYEYENEIGRCLNYYEIHNEN